MGDLIWVSAAYVEIDENCALFKVKHVNTSRWPTKQQSNETQAVMAWEQGPPYPRAFDRHRSKKKHWTNQCKGRQPRSKKSNPTNTDRLPVGYQVAFWPHLLDSALPIIDPFVRHTTRAALTVARAPAIILLHSQEPLTIGRMEEVRSGQWTPQEVAYATRLIDEFRNGSLQIPEGTSMRGFLADKLGCAPKRISKKVSYYY